MKARAPGSVTVMFVPVEGGSLGVSFAIADGVVAAVEPADETTVLLDGEPTGFEPVELALDELGVEARVALTSEVPVGCGFGASGAATLATALAVDAEWSLGRAREDLVDVAHRAELEAGTGLGDVFIQNRGGLLYDTGDGRARVEREASVAYGSWGGIATETVLGDPAAVERVEAAGRDALAAFDPEMSLSALFDLAWGFADGTGLATDAVRERVEEVRAGGGAATMAMVGETVVGTGGLPERTHIDAEGARVL